MELFNRFKNRQKFISKKSDSSLKVNNSGTRQGIFGLGNAIINADVPINVNAPTTNNSISRNITDARQISIIYDSPNSKLSSKKADKIEQSSVPTQSGATVPVDVPIGLGLGSGSNLLIAGVVIGGAYLLLRKKGDKK